MFAPLLAFAFAPAPAPAVFAIPSGEHGYECCAFSPDEALVALGRPDSPASWVFPIGWWPAKDGSVSLWDVRAGKMTPPLIAPGVGAAGLAFAPGGKLLLAGCDSGTLAIWDVPRRRLVGRVRAHREAVTALAFAPDGRHFATAGREQVVRVWDARTFEPSHTFRSFTHRIQAMAFAPDGRTLVTDGNESFASVWSLRHGGRVANVGVKGPVTGLAFDPHGQRLAVAVSGDFTALREKPNGTWDDISEAMKLGEVTVFDCRTWEAVRTCRPGDGSVRAVAFSPLDGRWLWGVSRLRFGGKGLLPAIDVGRREMPQEVVAWDAAAGTFVEGRWRSPHGVHQISVSPSGRRVLFRDASRVWLGDTARLFRQHKGG